MVYILLGRGFEEIEAVSPCDILRRGGVDVEFLAVGDDKSVVGSHGISVNADALVYGASASEDDTIVIPGGMGGVDSIKAHKTAMDFIFSASKSGAKLAAICAGPSVLAELGLIDGKEITCYPGTQGIMGKAHCNCENSTFADGDLITGRAPGAAIDFGLKLLSQLKGEETSNKIRMELVY